jgi:hypothetical protein
MSIYPLRCWIGFFIMIVSLTEEGVFETGMRSDAVRQAIKTLESIS